MPQELHVLRCYACKTFQVQIVKKVPKWQCKVCNEKQSVLKVYAQGSGKDCRQYVQDLNLQQGLLTAQEPAPDTSCNAFQQTSSFSYNEDNQNNVSKWSEYLDIEDKKYENDSTDQRNPIDTCQKSFKSRKTNPKENSIKQQKVTKWSSYQNEPETHVDVTLNQHNLEEIQEHGMESRKRKFSDTIKSSDYFAGDERSLPYEGFESTSYGQTGLKIQEEVHQNFPKKIKSKWSDYVESVDNTSTLSLTTTEKRLLSKRYQSSTTSTYNSVSLQRKPPYDPNPQCTSSLDGNSIRASFSAIDSYENLQSSDKMAARVPEHSVNPFCTTSDDILDTVLEF